MNGTKREHYGKDKEQFCDSRDGKKYVYVSIDTQTWMAENLNYDAIDSKCYNNDPANCTTYGGLYNWATAMTTCPEGWHLPTKAEWDVLTDAVGGSSTEGKYLKASDGWNSYNGKSVGTDAFGFSALPGGYSYSNYNYSIGESGRWWSASENGNNYAYNRSIIYYNDNADWRDSDYKSILYSIRCVQGSETK